MIASANWFLGAPSAWEVVRTKFLFNREQREVREDDEIVTAFRDGQVTLRRNRRMDGFTNSVKEIGYQGIRKGDLVVHAMDAFAGAVGLSDSDGKATPVYSACTPRRADIFTPYYARLLRHMALSGFIESLSKGIRERSTEFRWAELSEIALPVPPEPEQERIANFLDDKTARIDALIAEKERLLSRLGESEASQTLALISGGRSGAKTELVPGSSKWSGGPRDWKFLQLARLVSKLTNGFVGPTRDILVPAGVRYLQSLHIKAGKVDFSRGEYFVAEEWSLEHAKSILVPGDVLIVQTGDIGQTAVVTDEFAGCNCHALIIATPRRELVVPEYFELVLRSAYGRACFDMYSTGALHPHLNCSNIRDIRVPLPPLDLQRELLRLAGSIQETHRELALHVTDHITRLREYRSSLISAAVTGQLDISTFEVAA